MIVFSGGGSGGHTIVASTLIKAIQEKYSHQKISYVGSYNGLEKQVAQTLGIPYYAISTGKLRRYISVENFIDIFKFAFGCLQSVILLLGKLRKTEIIFSTGGFVSVPICLAGFLFRKKVYLHEQTTRIGLANKIVSKLCTKVFVSFDESLRFLPKEKTIVSGYPLRDSILKQTVGPENVKGLRLADLSKPLLFVTGGGNGAKLINDLILDNLSELKEKYIVFHQVGKKFIDDFANLEDENYKVFSFIGEEFVSIVRAASFIISRAGAGSVSEFIALKKKVVFIPLKIAQRNEQYHNAKEAIRYTHSHVITEDELPQTDILKLLNELASEDRQLEKSNLMNSSEIILKEVFS